MSRNPTSFRILLNCLLSHPPSDPTHLPPFIPSQLILPSDTIASLRLHPSLEAALHLLNNDLPSSHFLVRKMQSPPALEGMYIHAVLHRIEGDFENSKAWYRDVEGSEIVKSVGAGVGRGMVERLQQLVVGRRGKNGQVQLRERGEGDEKMGIKDEKMGIKDEKEWGALRRNGRDEIVKVIEFCARKFGEDMIVDAREAYVESGENIQKIKENMTTGGGQKGVREF